MGRALQSLNRYGMTPVHISGDEFLAYGVIDHADEALGLVTVVKDELERMNQEDQWICNITAGVGVYAAVPREEDNLDIFMTRSDQAMYEDKNKRKYGRRKDDIV
jgi:GGDEF domain-containing protein